MKRCKAISEVAVSWLAGIDVSASLDEQIDKLGMRKVGCVVQWCLTRTVERVGFCSGIQKQLTTICKTFDREMVQRCVPIP
jgi:hypothetical protein